MWKRESENRKSNISNDRFYISVERNQHIQQFYFKLQNNINFTLRARAGVLVELRILLRLDAWIDRSRLIIIVRGTYFYFKLANKIYSPPHILLNEKN
jgi:hypothetical protein